MKQFMSSTNQTSNLLGGHIMHTLPWETTEFVKKKHRKCDVFKNMNKKQRWKTVEIHELCFSCLEESYKVAKWIWGLTYKIN